jgi:predicted signal transduction protein with EAL and GGDEF domain
VPYPGLPLRQIMSGAGEYAYESIKERAGICRHFIVTAKALHDARGKAMGIVESFQDITMRKRSEETLEKVNRQLEALSNIDGLTGIANRRRFDEVLAQEHARHARLLQVVQ